MKQKYKQLSTLGEEWFSRMRKVFTSSRDQKDDVLICTAQNDVYYYGPILSHNSTQPKVIRMLYGKEIKQVEFCEEFMVVLTESKEMYIKGDDFHYSSSYNNHGNPTQIQFINELVIHYKSINPNFCANIEKSDETKENSEETIGIKTEETPKQTKFDNKSERVNKSMGKAFNNSKYSDLKIKIKRKEVEDFANNCPSDEPNDGFDYIHCHKWFVGENCKHLQKLIDEQMSENKSNEIEITEYSYETYFQFIQYLYTDSIDAQNTDLLLEMLSLADNYSEGELKSFCVTIIKLLINVENVCLFYSSAINNNSTDLEEYCFEFMCKNMKSIIKTKEYKQMDGNHTKNFLTKLYSK